MESDWSRHIVIAVVSGLLVAALYAFSAVRPPDPKGWRHIKPSATYIFGISLGTALTAFMAYIWLFVGSSRPDGEAQMHILFWLIVAFGGGTIISLFQYRQIGRTAMRWRGDTIVWHGRGGTVETRRLGDVRQLRKSLMGPVTVHFDDGASARIDPFAANAELLIETLAATCDNRGG